MRGQHGRGGNMGKILRLNEFINFLSRRCPTLSMAVRKVATVAKRRESMSLKVLLKETTILSTVPCRYPRALCWLPYPVGCAKFALCLHFLLSAPHLTPAVFLLGIMFVAASRFGQQTRIIQCREEEKSQKAEDRQRQNDWAKCTEEY